MEKNNLANSSENRENNEQTQENENTNENTIDESQTSLPSTNQGNNLQNTIQEENNPLQENARERDQEASINSPDNIYDTVEQGEPTTTNTENTVNNEGIKILSVRNISQNDIKEIIPPQTQPLQKKDTNIKNKSYEMIFPRRDMNFLEKIMGKNLHFLFQNHRKFTKEQFYKVLRINNFSNNLELLIEKIDNYLSLYKYKDKLSDEDINKFINNSSDRDNYQNSRNFIRYRNRVIGESTLNEINLDSPNFNERPLLVNQINNINLINSHSEINDETNNETSDETNGETNDELSEDNEDNEDNEDHEDNSS